jgi:uncharacterized damage-inducible protein DinB
MRVSDIRTLYEYTNWANQRLLDTALKATPEQWLAPGTAGRGSIRDTLTHMVGGQRMWLSWWDATGEADPGLRTALDPERYPDANALRAAWDVVHQATLRYIDTLSDADLLVEHVRPLGKVEALRLPLWQMMLHITSHNTQHRSEAAAMLTAFGHSPGELDLLRFLVPALL